MPVVTRKRVDRHRSQRPELNAGEDLFFAFVVACLSSLLAMTVGLYLAVIV